MQQRKDKDILELLEIYMDMVEKQDEIIFRMSELLKKYAREVNHLRNLNEYFSEEDRLVTGREALKKSMDELQEMRDAN